MCRILLTILTLALITMGAGAVGQEASEPDPALLQKQATEARMQVLMQLKQRANKAEAQQAKQQWAEQGKHMQARAEWAAQGRAQMQWPDIMEWYETNAEQVAPLRFEVAAHPYSPLGLLLRDMDAALAEGDTETADKHLQTATKVHARRSN